MNKSTWIGAAAGVLVGAIVAFPVGMAVAGQAEPETVIETKEVLPAACETLIGKSGEYIGVVSDGLRAAAAYPLIVSKMAGMMQDGDYSDLAAVADDMDEAKAGVGDAIEQQEAIDLAAAIDACAEYR